ncbi:MAG: linear amide C-N hydrolase [Elusimicrobia bacterium]|nr:linear amide C-N hydrolase [Elusimicrobiota bacterium]
MREASRPLLAALLAFGPAAPAQACTSFLVPSSGMMGKSYDWVHGDGMLVVNKRAVRKKALSLRPGGRPASWTSRFGSVTFNQHGREFPLGGINEAGLAVEVLWLDETRHPPVQGAEELNELQWIQYQLDRRASVSELVARIDEVRIKPALAPAHYFACDRGGDCATIEFLNGKASVHTGKALDVPAITNDTYEKSRKHLADHAGFGGNRPLPGDSSSLSRFVRAAFMAKYPDPSLDAQAHAFDILDSVRQSCEENNIRSRWQIVYDLAQARIALRLVGQEGLQRLDAAPFDYSCSSPVKVLELDPGLSGNISGRFVDYTRALNRKIVKKGLDEAGANFPPQAIEAIAAYPESLPCAEGELSARAGLWAESLASTPR